MTSPLRPWQRLGLRADHDRLHHRRALALSAILAGVTLYLARQNLLSQREDNAIHLLAENQLNLSQNLTPDISGQALDQVVQSLSSAQGSYSIVKVGDNALIEQPRHLLRGEHPPLAAAAGVVGAAGSDAHEDLGPTHPCARHAALAHRCPRGVLRGRAAHRHREHAQLAVLHPRGSSAVTALLAAVLGTWTSRRMLRPLAEASAAAEAIASGNLATRMAAPADRDLASLAGSFNEMAGALQERIERDAWFVVGGQPRAALAVDDPHRVGRGARDACRDDLPERAQTAVDLLSLDLQRFKQLVEDLLEISRFDIGTAWLELD